MALEFVLVVEMNSQFIELHEKGDDDDDDDSLMTIG